MHRMRVWFLKKLEKARIGGGGGVGEGSSRRGVTVDGGIDFCSFPED